jgi:L1 cell adhesion molecule like protein
MFKLQVIWKRFYNTKSVMDKGSLVQLRNSIDRRNVSASMENDFNSCDDFFNLVVRCHIIASTMEYLNMKSISDTPSHPKLKEDLWVESKDTRKDILQSIVNEIVRKYVDMEPSFDKHSNNEHDKVQCYASELLSSGLFYLEFADSIKEGDGNRILRCWRFLLLIFKATQRKNYSIEALNLLCQNHFFLSERQSMQLLWSRSINTHGIAGHNIPSDLFMEHLNRICKSAIGNLGPNKTPIGLKRAGMCVGVLAEVLASLDTELGVAEHSGHHSSPSARKDMNIILQQLLEARVFSYVENRKYHCSDLYGKIHKNCISRLNYNSLIKWMREQVDCLHNSAVVS